MAEALKANFTVTALQLGWNSIGADGAGHLAKALMTNTGLTSLQLDSSGI